MCEVVCLSEAENEMEEVIVVKSVDAVCACVSVRVCVCVCVCVCRCVLYTCILMYVHSCVSFSAPMSIYVCVCPSTASVTSEDCRRHWLVRLQFSASSDQSSWAVTVESV